jgi:Asp/Glu/hydantoin racemase
VFGAGSTPALLVKAMGFPVGIIGISDEPPDVINNILGDLIIGSAKPGNTNTALDLKHPSTIEDIKKAGLVLKEKGARSILLACTGMSPLGIASMLKSYLNIPVIDPLFSSLAVISYILTGNPCVEVN